MPFNPFGAGRANPGALNYIMATDGPADRPEPVRRGGQHQRLAVLPPGRRVVVRDRRRNPQGYGARRVRPAGLYAAQYWGFNNQPSTARPSVYEFFAETGVPILKDPTLAKSLSFNGAVRRTHYSQSGWVTSWKVGGEYEPADFLRFRATKSATSARPA